MRRFITACLSSTLTPCPVHPSLFPGCPSQARVPGSARQVPPRRAPSHPAARPAEPRPASPLSSRSTGEPRNAARALAPAQTPTPAQRCSSSTTRSVILPALLLFPSVACLLPFLACWIRACSIPVILRVCSGLLPDSDPPFILLRLISNDAKYPCSSPA